jgi:hypothetical protein
MDHTEPKTEAPLRDLNEEELRCVAGGNRDTWAMNVQYGAVIGVMVAMIGVGQTTSVPGL